MNRAKDATLLMTWSDRRSARRHLIGLLTAATMAGNVCLPALAHAHGVSEKDATFVESISGAAIGPFMYLGAKHMVTGYDHLLFLVGVIFFLYRLKDVVTYVSLFTLGHSLTLLAGVRTGDHSMS